MYFQRIHKDIMISTKYTNILFGNSRSLWNTVLFDSNIPLQFSAVPPE